MLVKSVFSCSYASWKLLRHNQFVLRKKRLKERSGNGRWDLERFREEWREETCGCVATDTWEDILSTDVQ